tara:strand:+ start:325 stop:759 length:435 start_codon:yes stop_codon:yes gene_type:complete
MKIKEVDAEQIRPLRHKELRQGKPFSTTSYQKDNEKETFHLACYINNKIVSCATFYPEKSDVFQAKKAYRLRGMATDEKYRKKGCGKKIMQEAFKKIKNKKGDLLWCNARLIAVEFYKKLGLSPSGDLFNISDIGPHYLMHRKL